ncbi:hypothetical protein ACFX13_003315 [Malus domestica]
MRQVVRSQLSLHCLLHRQRKTTQFVPNHHKLYDQIPRLFSALQKFGKPAQTTPPSKPEPKCEPKPATGEPFDRLLVRSGHSDLQEHREEGVPARILCKQTDPDAPCLSELVHHFLQDDESSAANFPNNESDSDQVDSASDADAINSILRSVSSSEAQD